MLLYEIARPSLLVLLALSAVLFAVRVIMAEILTGMQKGYVEYKPLGWYSEQEVYKATSAKTRKFMRRSNGFSTALWCILGLVVVLALITNNGF